MLHTHKTQSYLSLGLELFQDFYKFLTAYCGFNLLSEHFPQSSSMHKTQNKPRMTNCKFKQGGKNKSIWFLCMPGRMYHHHRFQIAMWMWMNEIVRDFALMNSCYCHSSYHIMSKLRVYNLPIFWKVTP